MVRTRRNRTKHSSRLLLAEIVDFMPLTGEDTFYDLGSGVGKLVMQVASTTPCNSVGVELGTAYACPKLFNFLYVFH